jgi:DNA-binding PadR family transcriptional regulator
MNRSMGRLFWEQLQQISSDLLRVPQGSLYPALHRLERCGWIAATGEFQRTTGGQSRMS